MPQQWTGRWQPQLSGTGAYAPTTGSRNRTWDTLEYLRKMQPPKTTPLPTRYPSEQMYRGQVEYYKRRLQAGEKPEDLVKEITATQEQKAKAEQALYSQQLEWGKAYGAAAREVEKETQWEREFGRKERGTTVAETRETRLAGAQTWKEEVAADRAEAARLRAIGQNERADEADNRADARERREQAREARAVETHEHEKGRWPVKDALEDARLENLRARTSQITDPSKKPERDPVSTLLGIQARAKKQAWEEQGASPGDIILPAEREAIEKNKEKYIWQEIAILRGLAPNTADVIAGTLVAVNPTSLGAWRGSETGSYGPSATTPPVRPTGPAPATPPQGGYGYQAPPGWGEAEFELGVAEEESDIPKRWRY